MSELLLINPRKRRAKRRKTTVKRRRHVARASNPVPALKHRRRGRTSIAKLTRRHRRRRNPIGGNFSVKTFSRDTLMPSVMGAAGALGLDVIFGYLPLPVSMRTGVALPLMKILGAVGLGYAATKIAGRRVGEQVGAGAITVVLYETGKQFIQTHAPSIQLGSDVDAAMGWMNPAMGVDGIDSYIDQGFPSGAPSEMGAYDSEYTN